MSETMHEIRKARKEPHIYDDYLKMRGLRVMQHALGLDEFGRGSKYRNHFVTGTDSVDFDCCRLLVAGGLMRNHGTGSLYGGGFCFTVTDAGQEYIRLHSPDPPKMTAGHRRYISFLEEDCGIPFGEWLRRRPAASDG